MSAPLPEPSGTPRRLGSGIRDPLGLTSKPPVLGRIVTATITLTCAGRKGLSFSYVPAVIIVGPIVAFCHDTRLLRPQSHGVRGAEAR